MHCWQAITALREHGAALPPADGSVSLIVLFDHEEVGSDSPTGASGPLVSEVMQRITSCFAEDTPHASSEALLVTIRNSFLVSADAAHAVHPNYAEKHEANHKPKLNQGLTIKTNDNMRYATNGETAPALSLFTPPRRPLTLATGTPHQARPASSSASSAGAPARASKSLWSGMTARAARPSGQSSRRAPGCAPSTSASPRGPCTRCVCRALPVPTAP